MDLRIIMRVPNWNSEDNGKLFTLFSVLDEAVLKSKLAEMQETLTCPSSITESKLSGVSVLGFFGWLVVFLVLWLFYNASSVKLKKLRCQHLILSCTSHLATPVLP